MRSTTPTATAPSIVRILGEALALEPGAALRKIQRSVKPLLYAEEVDGETRFAAFLVSTLVEQVFYNFSGDFPYDERWATAVKEARASLLRDLRVGMPPIGAALEQGNNEQLLKQSVALVSRYVDAIVEIRKLSAPAPESR